MVPTQVTALTFDDSVRTVVSFEEWAQMTLSDRAGLAQQRLTENKPTWRATHLGNALIAAAEILEDTDKREQHLGPRRIVLITDLQEGSRLEGLQGHEWPRGLEVVVEPVKAKRPTNAGLAVGDGRGRFRALPPRMTTCASGSIIPPMPTREQFQLRWAGVADGAPLDAYVPPGQSRIVPAPKLPTCVR